MKAMTLREIPRSYMVEFFALSSLYISHPSIEIQMFWYWISLTQEDSKPAKGVVDFGWTINLSCSLV